LDRLIYVRNIDSTFNHEGSIEHTIEVELFYKGHKERMEIDVRRGQKWSMILENIGNTISLDPLYKDLVTLLG